MGGLQNQGEKVATLVVVNEEGVADFLVGERVVQDEILVGDGGLIGQSDYIASIDGIGRIDFVQSAPETVERGTRFERNSNADIVSGAHAFRDDRRRDFVAVGHLSGR